MIKFQRDVEESIISRVEAVDRESRPPTSDLHPDAVASLLTLREKGGVILVDIPSDRPAATTGLEYLPETRLKDFVDEWEHPVKLEDSLIWSELQRSLPNAVGKVRILCHPAARRTILAAVPEDAFEDILSTAIARSAASRQ